MEKDLENQPDSMMEYDQDSPGPEKVVPLGVSADKPLQGKSKFPNMKKSSEEEDVKDGSKVKDHCCMECKKRFSSGKALGGHISMAHVQAKRDFSLRRLKSKKKPLKKLVGSSSPDYGRKNICKICWKDFPTNRSLFGHMKCHPDRGWRGVDPPAEDATNFLEPEFEAVNRVPPHVLDGDQIDSGPVVASSAVGLNESVKWQVTGQRGRAATKTVTDLLPLQSSEEIVAVQQLVRLLDGDSRKPSEDLDSSNENSWVSEDETDDINQDFQLNKNKEKVFPVGEERDSPVKKLKIWERPDENPGGAQVGRFLYNVKGKGKLDHGFDNEFSTNRSTMIKEKTREEKKSVRPELPPNFSPIGLAAKSVPPAATPDKYIFSTCRESFSTPIALGGQSSSHKEIKVRIYNTIDYQSSNGASYAKDEPKVNAIKQLEVNKALGIQNQCHCTGECNHPDHITSTDEAKKERKVCRSDLGEMPNEDGKDEKESGAAAS